MRVTELPLSRTPGAGAVGPSITRHPLAWRRSFSGNDATLHGPGKRPSYRVTTSDINAQPV